MYRKVFKMDPKLLQEREKFKQRAMAVPVIEKKPDKKPEKKPDRQESRPVKKFKSALQRPVQEFDYKTATTTPQNKFAVLAKIVQYMKNRHQEGESHGLSVDEILDEKHMTDLPQRVKIWLGTEALMNNPKIEVVDGDKFRFKPKYNIRNKKALMRLLNSHDQRGLGGIMEDDIEESLPKAQKAFKTLEDEIIFITRPQDKKRILFYNDRSGSLNVDEDVSKLWRAVTVEGVDENKIEEYLQRQGIASMQDLAMRRPVTAQKRKKGNKRRKAVVAHNEHMADILQDYSK